MTEQISGCWSEGALAAQEHEGTFWGDRYVFYCDRGYTNVDICQNSSTCAYNW